MKTDSCGAQGDQFVVAVEAHESQKNTHQGGHGKRIENQIGHGKGHDGCEITDGHRRSEKIAGELEQPSHNEDQAQPEKAHTEWYNLFSDQVLVKGHFHPG